MFFKNKVRIIISCNLFVVLLLVLSVSTSIMAIKPHDAASIKKIYNTSENTIDRKVALQSLSSMVSERGAKTPQWVSDLLQSALNDKSPVVVSEAAFQIGVFGLPQLTTNLITLYKNANIRFGASGYDRRVQYSIIPTLGKIGNSEAKNLIVDILEKDNCSPMGEYLLLAVKDLNDLSLLNAVKKYKHRMHQLLSIQKQRGDDPLLYSRKLAYIEMAMEVEKSLLEKGGK